MIDISPDYRLAGHVIDRLKQDADLQSLVLDEVWDNRDTASKLAAAAGKFNGVITVTPSGLVNQYSEDGQIMRLHATLGISLLVTPGATRRDPLHKTAGSYLSGLVYAVLCNLIGWSPRASRIPYDKPVIHSVEDYDLSKDPDLKNLMGKAIIMTAPVNLNLNQPQQ